MIGSKKAFIEIENPTIVIPKNMVKYTEYVCNRRTDKSRQFVKLRLF